MSTTPPEAPPPTHETEDTGPRVTRDQVRDLGRLRRSITDRKVAGVAGGLGRHLDVDPLILRVAFVVLAFFGGAGLILYGACWLLLPEDGSDRAPFHLDDRTRGVALIIVGAIAALALLGDSWGAFWFPWPLAVVALVVLWLLTRNNGGTATYGPPASDQPPTPAATQEAAPAYAPPPAYVPPPAYFPPPAPPRPRDPRKRGPILFWLTLALSALGVGLLGIADLAGAPVPDPAYPALVVAICGVMLVVGAFYGRAGGIILLALLSTFGLVVSTAADQWDDEQERFVPTSVSVLGDHYEFTAGDRVIDLREIADVEALDGETLRIRGDIGRIRLYLPDDIGATVTARVTGFGHTDLFGDEYGGTDIDQAATVNHRADVQLNIDVELGVGSIEVDQS